MKISSILSEGLKSVRNAVLMHPTALVMLLYCFIMCMCAKSHPDEKWLSPTVVAPACIVISLALEYLVKEGRRWALLIIPVFFATIFIPGITDWPGTVAYRIITAVVLPLAILLYRRSYGNDDYIRHTVKVLWSLIIAVTVASVAAMLMFGICFTIDKLFSTELISSWIGLYLGFPYVLLCPMLFIGLSEREDIRGTGKFLEVLINWIVTPALIIYSAVLLAYTIKIVCTWILPCGGVAAMCLIWGIFAFLVTSTQPLFEKHPFPWFPVAYRYLSIPFVILLWTSIIRRVVEYGVTPSRYYLVLCGMLMTAFIVISIFGKKNTYYTVTAVAAALFLTSVAVPGISYNGVTVASQVHQIKKYAAELNILGDDGTLIKVPKDGIENQEKLAKMTDAMKYVRRIDQAALSELGDVTYESLRGYEEISLHMQRDDAVYSVEGFSKYQALNTVTSCSEAEGTDEPGGRIVVADKEICFQQIFESKLKELGAPEKVTKDFLKGHSAELLIWDIDDWRLILRELCVNVYASGKTPEVSSMTIDGILIK